MKKMKSDRSNKRYFFFIFFQSIEDDSRQYSYTKQDLYVLCTRILVITNTIHSSGSECDTQELMSKGDEVVYSITVLVISLLIIVQLSF